jgi:hypothetical protein
MAYQHPGRVSPAGPKGQKTSSSEVDSKSVLGREKKNNFLKMNEQYGNVIENKGPLWKT